MSAADRNTQARRRRVPARKPPPVPPDDSQTGSLRASSLTDICRRHCAYRRPPGAPDLTIGRVRSLTGLLPTRRCWKTTFQARFQ